MSLLDDYKINKSLISIDLVRCTNQRKQPVLAVKASNNNRLIHLKRFFGENQYRRWILEAALLHLLVGDKYKKDLSRIFKKISETAMNQDVIEDVK